MSTSQLANVLLPEFPQEREHDRADHEPDKPEHFEAAEAAHQHPDETQSNSVARHRRPHDLVATRGRRSPGRAPAVRTRPRPSSLGAASAR